MGDSDTPTPPNDSGPRGIDRRESGPEAQFRRFVTGELKTIERRIEAVNYTAKKALELIEGHDGRMTDVERTLYGHPEEHRREVEPGVVHVVNELSTAFKDVRAVARAGWALMTLVGFSTLLSLLTLFMGR